MDEVIDLTSLENSSTTGLDRKILEVFKSLMNGDLTPKDAAHEIDELCSATVPVNEETNEKNKTTEKFLWNLWTMMIRIVQECPMARLSILVDMLQHLRGINSRDVNQRGVDRSLWQDLPFFAARLRDDLQSPFQHNSESKDIVAQRWIRLNSFAARVLGKSLTELRLLHLAIRQLRNILEEVITNETDLSTRIAIVSEWIQHAGQVLFDTISSWAWSIERLGGGSGVTLEPGSLYPRTSRVDLKRWTWWKQRLRKLGIDAGGDVREQALGAVRVMEGIEEERRERGSGGLVV